MGVEAFHNGTGCVTDLTSGITTTLITDILVCCTASGNQVADESSGVSSCCQ